MLKVVSSTVGSFTNVGFVNQQKNTCMVKPTLLSLIIYLSNANVNMTISKNIDSIKLQPSVLFAFVELFKHLIVTNFHRHSPQKNT